MTHVRMNEINPLKNLTQTAYDLAFYLRYVNPTEIILSSEEIKKEYNAPRQSWLTWPIYALFNLRNRTNDLDKTIAAFQEIIETRHTTSEYVKQKPVLSLIDKGGWEDTSLNTNFLRMLVRKIPGYNPKIILSKDEVLQLRELLGVAFDERIRAEVKLNEQQKKLRLIDKAREQKEKELFKKQDELLRKQEEVTEYVNKLADLEEKQTTKDARLKEIEKNLNDYTLKVQLIEKEKVIKENELNNIEQEKVIKENELEATRKILTALSPDFDMKGLDESQMDEAVMIAKVAVRTYKEQIQEQKNKKNELASLGIVSARKKQETTAATKQPVLPSSQTILKKEMQDMIGERKKHETIQSKNEFQSHLSLLFKMKAEKIEHEPALKKAVQKPVFKKSDEPVLKKSELEPVTKKIESSFMQERKKALLENGFLANLLANPVKATKENYMNESVMKKAKISDSEINVTPTQIPESVERLTNNIKMN